MPIYLWVVQKKLEFELCQQTSGGANIFLVMSTLKTSPLSQGSSKSSISSLYMLSNYLICQAKCFSTIYNAFFKARNCWKHRFWSLFLGMRSRFLQLLYLLLGQQNFWTLANTSFNLSCYLEQVWKFHSRFRRGDFSTTNLGEDFEMLLTISLRNFSGSGRLMLSSGTLEQEIVTGTLLLKWDTAAF